MRGTALALACCAGLAPVLRAEDPPPPDRAHPVVQALKATDVEVRRGAALRIRASDRSTQRAALPTMIDLLMNEKDGQVRLAVLDTVTALGADAASAVPALVHTLRTNYGGQGKEELHQDYRSALALAAVGRPAVEGLRGLLKERKENVPAEVVMALGRIGPAADAATADLVPLLADPSERIRREAALALGRIGPAAVDPLIAACGSADVTLRARAVESLGYLSAPSERVQFAVLDRAGDAAPEVQAAALRSLSRFPLPADRVLPILKETLRSENEPVRLAAVNLLVGRRALLPPLAPELESLLTAGDEGVSRHAAFLLGKLGPEAALRLINALRVETSRIGPIAEALAQMGRPALGVLNEAVKAPEPRVRRAAALALGQIRPLPPDTVSVLSAGLNDRDVEVRSAFLTAIGYLGLRAGEAAPAVRSLLRDRSPEIRIQAIEILARSAPRDERLIADLGSLVNDPDTRVQRQAIDRLRSQGPPGRKALKLVVGKLNSPDPEVRLSAAEFLGSHGHAAAEAVPALTALLDDPLPRLRTTAAQTLGVVGKPAQPAFDRLTHLLDADQPEVREAAVMALGSLELDTTVLRPHLARALKDEKPEVRRAATRVIQRMGPDGALFVPDIILLARSKENVRSVERSLRPFERTGPDPRSLPDLIALVGHDQTSVRLLAIKFLGLAGPRAQGAIPSLERLRDDPSAEVRNQAEAAIEQIKKKPSSSPEKR